MLTIKDRWHKPAERKGDSDMEFMHLTQTLNALAAIAMILMGSAWLKRCLWALL